MFAEPGIGVGRALRFDIDTPVASDVPVEAAEAETATMEGDPNTAIFCGRTELTPVTGTGLDATIDISVGVISFDAAKEVGVSTETFEGAVTTAAAAVSVTVG